MKHMFIWDANIMSVYKINALYLQYQRGHHHNLTNGTVSNIPLAPGFKPQPGYVWTEFHISLYLVTFGGHLAHLMYAQKFL